MPPIEEAIEGEGETTHVFKNSQPNIAVPELPSDDSLPTDLFESPDKHETDLTEESSDNMLALVNEILNR